MRKMAIGILGVQLLGTLFGLFMTYYMFLHYKRNEFTIKEYGFWLLFWIVFVVVALFPGLLDPIVEKLNFVRTMDFFIVSGFLFLIAVDIYIYTLLRKNQKSLEEMVRKIAIKKK